MTAIDVRGLQFSYGSAPVLDHLDLEVPDATLVAVIGPSGCGKTTLLRVLAGFERPGAGTVEIGGEAVAGPGLHVPPHRRRVGIVPQEGALFPHLDVADNIGFALARRSPDRAARVAELVELAGLAGLEHRYPRELSGGQQQRVALARALAPRPRVVLLDEPFAALDAGTRRSVRASVRDVLAAAGATAVLVTHDRDEALSMADLVAVLVEGRVRQVAAPHDVYDRPVDRTVAALLGEVNLVPSGSPLVSHLALGADLDVVVRPEQLRATEPGAVAGRVISAEFAGSVTRVVVALDDRTELVASLTDARPRTGDRIGLTVSGQVHPVARG